jgi:hypothetical protein
MREELAAANRTLGALHVLIRCAKAEADCCAGGTAAVRTLEMADNLILVGDISSQLTGIGFGRG